MEEEYRMQKAQADIRETRGPEGVIHKDGTVVSAESATLQEIMPVQGEWFLHNQVPRRQKSQLVSEANGNGEAELSPKPTIRISTESVREKREADKSTSANGDLHKPNGVEIGELQTTVQAAAGGEDDAGDGKPVQAGQQEPLSFRNKRLCERWLDNLFMVLYEVCSHRLKLVVHIVIACFRIYAYGLSG